MKYVAIIFFLLSSAATLTADYFRIVNQDEPICWWRFETDTCRDGDYLTNNGSSFVEARFLNSCFITEAGINRCILFNGHQANVELGRGLRSLLEDSQQVTFEAWIMVLDLPDEEEDTKGIFAHRLNAAMAGIDIMLIYNPFDAAHRVYLQAAGRSCPTDSYQKVSTPYPQNHGWHHTAVIFDYANKSISIFIDGELRVETAVNFSQSSYRPGTDYTQADRIGTNGGQDKFYRGFLDELAIYNRALSSQQVQDHFSNALARKPGRPWLSQIADNGGISGRTMNHPGIIILDDGTYVAKYNATLPARSLDGGINWQIGDIIPDVTFSSMFKLGEILYMMGTHIPDREICIFRSTDNGFTWTTPTGPNDGMLFTCPYGFSSGPMPVVVKNGRIFRAYEMANNAARSWKLFSAVVVSAPVNSDLLKSENWTISEPLQWQTSWQNGWPLPWEGGGWLEGNMVLGPDDKLYNIIRVDSRPNVDVAAMISVSDDGATLSFDPEKDFISFPGGMTKFTIRRDPFTKLYLSLVNNVTDPSNHYQRNTMSLTASRDLRHWSHVKTLLMDDLPYDWQTSMEFCGFQYIDWQFEGDDIIYVSRTAYDGTEPPRGWHDANRLTFHRIENYVDIIQPWSTSLGYWRFDENIQGEAGDCYDYADNLILGPSLDCPTWVDGVQGSALKFNGNQYCKMENAGSMMSDSFTIEAFIKLEQLPEPGICFAVMVLSESGQSPLKNYQLRIRNISGSIYFCGGYTNPSGIFYETVSQQTLTAETWYYVGFSFDSQNQKTILRLNDQSWSASAVVSPVSSLAEPVLWVGTDSDGEGFIGIIDNLRISDCTLETPELLYHHLWGIQKSDINMDGTVDFSDFAVFASESFSSGMN